MMERVLYPHEVEKPDDGLWLKRLKYTAVDELIADYEASNAAIGRTGCPVLEYMRANRTKPLEEVEVAIYGHPHWGPTALCETAWKTLAFNHATSHPHGEHIAAWVQHFAMRELVKHDWTNARHPMSEMLKEPAMVFVSPEAATLALGYFVAHHPNPRTFFEKYGVGVKFPGLDVSTLAAPDFLKTEV